MGVNRSLPNSEEELALLRDASSRADAYVASIPRRRVFPNQRGNR